MSENNDSSRSDATGDRSTNAENYRPRPRNSRDTPSTTRTRGDEAESEASNEPFTRIEWENLASDPDMRADLGYSIAAWETIETATDSDQVIYMPQDEELLRDDTFIVAEQEILCDLGKQY